MKWVSNHLEITPPKHPKKITGTRFAAIMGLNKWASPFATWCEITRTYEKPFVDTKYTRAGKAIEPKQADYIEKYYGLNVTRPADVYGEDFFKKTKGDFFPEVEMLGGMWDFLADDSKTNYLVECKTTQRAEDWEEDIPEYYALQAALYAYLKGYEWVMMVVSFLQPSDYDDPDAFVCTGDNTAVVTFNLYERYPDFENNYVQYAIEWWMLFVETGMSPDFNEDADAEILKILRTNSFSPDTDIHALMAEAETLMHEIEYLEQDIKPKKDRLATIKDIVKEYATEQFREGDTRVEINSGQKLWTVSRSTTTKVNEAALKKDGLYDHYKIESPSMRLTISNIKEEE